MSLIIENLSFAYGRALVLDRISARASPGRITAVIGPNAAGKSTLLKCVIGALRPQQGRVLIDDLNVHRLSARQAAGRIAYVPQRSIVSAAFTVRQVVELGRYALPAHARRVDHALARLDLADIADRPYPALSVGQQQRVTLARAMAQLTTGGYLVLDEPTSAMDLRHIAACMNLLHELADGGATVVVAMHDVGLAASVADDVWLMDRGAMIMAGPIDQVLTIDRLQQVFAVPFQWVDRPNGRRRLLPDAPVASRRIQ